MLDCPVGPFSVRLSCWVSQCSIVLLGQPVFEGPVRPVIVFDCPVGSVSV